MSWLIIREQWHRALVKEAAVGFVVLATVIVAAFTYAFIRNNQVYQFRDRLLQQIHAAARNDIRLRNRAWEWRYDKFSTVTYQEMVFSFRKLRASSYYDDVSFLEDK